MKALLAVILCMSMFLFSCQSARDEPLTWQYGEMKSVMDKAQENGQFFVAVSTKEGCMGCHIIESWLHSNNVQDKGIFRKFMFYKVHTELPENAWFDKWRNDIATPVSYIFGPDGRLITFVANGNPAKLSHILEKLGKGFKDSLFEYNSERFGAKGDSLMNVLNTTFNAHRILEEQRHSSQSEQQAILRELTALSPAQRYFYTDYLAARFARQLNDSAAARTFTRSALTFLRGDVDAMIYNDLKNELKYGTDSSYDVKGPYLAVEEVNKSLGNLKKDSVVQVSFKFSNKGHKQLMIKKLRGSCDCLSMDFPKHGIKPGEEGEIKVTVRLKNEGPIHQTVHVFSNAVNNPVMLSIQAHYSFH